MSKTDLLTIEEARAAAAQGWSLGHVYDLATRRWRVMVLGMPSAEAVSQHVVHLARNGQPLALKALSLVMKSNSEN